MRRRLLSLSLGVTVAVGVLAGPVGWTPGTAFAVSPTAVAAVPDKPADLRRDLDAILSDARLARAKIGVDVRVAEGGTSLYSRGTQEAVMPASNAKLLTAATALDVLGPKYRFRTTVNTAGTMSGSTLQGDLALQGNGDPTVRPADYDALAKRVAGSGIRRVKGHVLADASYFDDQRWNPNWDPADEQYAYAAQISALTVATTESFDTGSVQIDVVPGEQGKPLKAVLSPASDYIKLENKSTTGAPSSASTLSIERLKDSNTISVTGSHPSDGAPVQKLRSVNDPALYAASVFRAALEKYGVTVTGENMRGVTPDSARLVTSRRSVPLSEIMAPFLKLSNNGIADILTKAIGKKITGEGSWSAGTKAIIHHVRSFGVNSVALTLVDGSGLSFDDRVSAQGIADLLSNVRVKSWFPIYYKALPIAGEPEGLVGGTLTSRMVGTPAAGNVHAKTGSLTGATALSGYVRDPNQRLIVFSIFFNNYAQPTPTDIQDVIAVRLASGESSSAAVLLSAPKPRGTAVEPELEASWLRYR
ncbi:MAG: D-alanyl-D-alanine carboxypeptidase/D-alanyl-D-alanine endopeptidase [Mycobacteriales bacterium]